MNEELLRSQTSCAALLQQNMNSGGVNTLIQQPLVGVQLQRSDTLQPSYTKETMEFTYTPTTGHLKFQQSTPSSLLINGNYQNSIQTPQNQDSQAKNLFQEQFSQQQTTEMKSLNDYEDSRDRQNEIYFDQMCLQTPIQGQFQSQKCLSKVNFNNQMSPNYQMQQLNNISSAIDPSQISPEYFQLFNQFFQMFQQVQAATQIDLSNDPQFLQNMMIQYFTFMTQNGGQDGALSPQKMRDYENLPLAAIPESKDSILEENSGWGTVKTNKLALSSITNQQQQLPSCNCCQNCQDMKKKGIYQQYQQCSNFNLGQLNCLQNSQFMNQETFIQKSDVSNSQILNNQFGGLGSLSPSPMHKQNLDLQAAYATVNSQLNQNLNSMFQQQVNYSLEPAFNQYSNYQSRKESIQTQLPSELIQVPHVDYQNYPFYLKGSNFKQNSIHPQYNNYQIFQEESNQQNVMDENKKLNLSPDQCQLQNQLVNDHQQQQQLQKELALSPQQIQQNKLIEYMIDNNDFSNYKQRREVIKGKRMSRTLSRSNSKNNTFLRLHKHKLSLQSSNMNYNNHTQRFSNQFSQQNYNNNDDYQHQQFFSEQKQNCPDNYASNRLDLNQNQKPLMFFSPQLTNKQQCYVFRSNINDVMSDQDMNSKCGLEKQQIMSGQVQLQNYEDQECIASPFQNRTDRGSNQNEDDQLNDKNRKRKRTQERIQEIRRLNEIQRGKEQQKLLKKSTTRKNLHKTNQQQSSQVKNVFEIKDLKQTKAKKNNHYRKQSQNIVSNKENNKLIQSNLHHQYEMSQQHIALSPQQDPFLISIEQEFRKKDSNTFKSLNSVANIRLNQAKQQLNNEISDSPQSPPINNFKLILENHLKNQVPSTSPITPFENNFQNIGHQKATSLQDLNQLLAQQDENRKPGQEIHIIKKPVQTEEFKKIQERLNKYYQDKRKEEVSAFQNFANGQINSKHSLPNVQNQNRNQQANNIQQNDFEAMSMTKTLSSFKSLMMKTMSQMSIQQDNNIQNQFKNGKDQRRGVNSKQADRRQGSGQNQSVNVSSIQDDYSVGVDYSENLTKIMSPQNFYNGSLANIKHRNQKITDQQITDYNNTLQEKLQIYQELPSNQKQQCLPNSLFFKDKNHNHLKKPSNEDTLSLKYNSRPPSICYCGQINNCMCCQDSKKDLLSHFQNFLSEMDKHPHFNNNGFPINRESLYQSPIDNIRHSNSTNDFLLSNFQFLNINGGRSSSQNSRLLKPKSIHNNRQSSVSANASNILGQPKMKRFSSGATLTNLPLKKISKNLNHCQSTQVFPHLKKISIDSDDNQINEIVIKQIKEIQQSNSLNEGGFSSSPSKLTVISQEQLERLDTNKEEELRLLNIENDIMQRAFIMKSHKLNLQDGQRNELLQRIQMYKQQQVNNKVIKNNLSGGDGASGVAGYSTLHEDGQYSNQHAANGSTQNTSHVTALGYGSNSLSAGNHSIGNQQQINHQHNLISLEERRKMEKQRKQADLINQIQIDRQLQ